MAFLRIVGMKDVGPEAVSGRVGLPHVLHACLLALTVEHSCSSFLPSFALHEVSSYLGTWTPPPSPLSIGLAHTLKHLLLRSLC